MRVVLAMLVVTSGCTTLLDLEEPTRRDAGVVAPPREPCTAIGELQEQACGSESCARESRECLPDGWGAWGACACDGFRAITPPPFAGRAGHAQVWTGDRFLVWGGTSNNGLLADGAQYDPRTNTWIAMSPSPLSPRADVAAVWTGRAWFLWGGRTGPMSNYTSADDGALYDPRTDRWATLPPSPLRGAGSATAFFSSA